MIRINFRLIVVYFFVFLVPFVHNPAIWYYVGKIKPIYIGFFAPCDLLNKLISLFILPVIFLIFAFKKPKHRYLCITCILILTVTSLAVNNWYFLRGAFEKGVYERAKKYADIPQIRTWMDIIDVSNSDSGYIYDTRKWPPSIKKLSPLKVSIESRNNNKYVEIGWGGGLIENFGITIGSPEMEQPESCSEIRIYPLSPGAYVWSEL